MGLTVEELRKLIAEEAKKQKPAKPDPFEDWGEEIDHHPISNPCRRTPTLAEGSEGTKG